jgi:Zn-dependent peptidase ImmA (M78 family)
MLSNTEIRTIQLRAALHAKRARKKLGCEDQEWVDVFEAIDRLGVLLLFSPIRSLCGAYMPKTQETGVAGIVVSTIYPLSVQRLTAAHELGHYLMDHAPSLDHDTDIDHDASDTEFVPRAAPAPRVRDTHVDPEQEVAAEAFAAHFLMPKNRVVGRIKALGWGEEQLRKEDSVYELSLWFGVSYSAMVWHLVALKLLPYIEASRLAKTKPKAIKQALGGKEALPNWQNDVWPLEETDSGATIHARVGDALAINLPSHADGGYLWEPEEAPEGFEVDVAPKADDPVVARARAREGFLAGYSPRQQALVRLTGDGTLAVRLAECLPWERSRKAGKFNVIVVSQSAMERGLSPRLRRRHLELVG